MATNKISILKALLVGLLLLLPLSARAQTTPLSDLDALRYIASQPDLIAAFGADAAKGRSHYETWGIKEGRKITFEPLNYTASHPDLMAAFGIDEIKAATHYIQWGFKEGRKTTFNPLNYIASQPDLISAFGADAAKGARHYIQNGYAEKRQITFDPARYMASHPDLIQAFAGDETKAATHYIQWGYKEKRQTTFTDLDALQYVASFADLIQSIGSDVVTAIRHYVTTGYNAGRRISFDALAYIASHGDLIAAFGTDALAGVKHYLNWGYKEGRQVIFDALGYLSRHTDLQQAFGSDTVAATKHYINWGFKEGRTYALTVSATTSEGGTVSKSRAYVNLGARETFVFTPNKGYYLDSVSGCNGTLSGQNYTTAPVSAACQISAVFKLLFGDISGTVTAYDASRPAFVTLVSAKDDSVLESQQVGASGAFKFTNLDGRKDYYVDFEQPGREPTAAVVEFGAQRQATRNDSSMIEKIGNFFGIASSESVKPFAVSAMIGDKVNFTASPIKGLTENEFNYRWEADGTVSGSEIMSYVPNPTRVEALGKAVVPANTESANRLAERFGIVLVNPDSANSSTDALWTEEYTDRLYEVLAEMPFAVIAGESTTKWPGITRIKLSKQEIPEDVSKSTTKFIGGEISIAVAAFENATPSLARIDGKRGIFFSNRLFRVALRIATENGTNGTVMKEIFRSRFGLQVASNDAEGMVIRPEYCEAKTEYRRDCESTEWRVFSPDEFLFLASIYEEYPQPLKDLSSSTQLAPLKAAMRRRIGSKSPLVPTAAALANINQGYMEFLDPTFFNGGNRADTYRILVHEKAHFVWHNLDARSRLDWARLSGWWRNPVIPGSTSSVSGNCDKWKLDASAWTPPNTTDSDLQTNGLSRVVIGHDDQRLDEQSLRNGWGNCGGGVDFVSAYAATNPNEDFSDSFGFFMTNPDKLRTVAPKKYDFLRDRVMQGTAYVSRIRSDLTFEVYNLYPDYTYPGKIKNLTVKAVGKPTESKQITITVELFTADCVNGTSCPTDVVDGYATLRSREVFPGKGGFGNGGVRIDPGCGTIGRGVMQCGITLPATAPAGWWQLDELVFRTRTGDMRKYKQQSEDFGFALYINNPNEDIIPPEYVPNSLKMRLLDKTDPLASPSLPVETRQIYYSFRVKENSPGFSVCGATYVYEPSDPSQRIRPLNVVALVTPLSGAQSDGANYLCEGLINLSPFKRSGTYTISRVAFFDGPGVGAGGLEGEYSFSFKGTDPKIERAPEVVFQSSRSDTVAPEMDIQRCISSDLKERCLRVEASPTVPAAPNGETEVKIYYWARENQSLETASGLGFAYFFLRDPTGKVFTYLADSSSENLSGSGVPGYSPVQPVLSTSAPIKSGDGRLFPVWSKEEFECPASAPKPCDATTWVQYRAKVLLPRGSAPGTWGLSGFSLEDKVWGGRTYDFTELFRFDPYKPTGDGGRDGVQGAEGANPFTFTVRNAAKVDTNTAIERSSSSDTAFLTSVNAWLGRLGNSAGAGGMISRSWEALVSSVSNGLSPSERTTGSSELRSRASASDDTMAGSTYRLIRIEEAGGMRHQWTLEYRGRNDALFSTKSLPDTAEVSWRRFGRIGEQLATTGWARVCSDRVWAVQDGYQLLFHVGDRALTDLRPGQLFVNSTAEATIITDVRCAFGGAVWIEGYAFGVSDNEPPLRTSSVPATRFGFALDRYGAVTKREVSSAPFDIVGLCSAPANEQQMFCSEAKKAVGW